MSEILKAFIFANETRAFLQVVVAVYLVGLVVSTVIVLFIVIVYSLTHRKQIFEHDQHNDYDGPPAYVFTPLFWPIVAAYFLVVAPFILVRWMRERGAIRSVSG